jgi:hypothetical protein
MFGRGLRIGSDSSKEDGGFSTWKYSFRSSMLRCATPSPHPEKVPHVTPPLPSPKPQEDPVVKAARHEACLALCMWVVAMCYTVTYCYANGYGRAVESLRFVLWFPDWVFWGIVVPWVLCVLLSIPFAFRLMGDESLGEEMDEEPGNSGTPRDVNRG